MTKEELRDYVDEQRTLNNIPYHVYSALIDGIDTLEQEPKTGRWIDTEFTKLKECSICHARWGIYSIEQFDFCPSCGAKMIEPQKSEVEE